MSAKPLPARGFFVGSAGAHETHILVISREFEEPSDNFVRYFATQVYTGRMTQPVRDQFADITKRALNRYLNDRINELLTSAMKGAPAQGKPAGETEPVEDSVEEPVDPKKQITTTAEEMEGLFAVKSVLRGTIDVKRVSMRDTKSYCGILLDDNSRKPICRLYLEREQKYIGIFDDQRIEQRMPIGGVDDIYAYSEAIVNRVNLYEEQK